MIKPPFIKSALIRFRNAFLAKNRFRISRDSRFENHANINATDITSNGRNEIVLGRGVRLTDLSIELRGNSNVLRIGENAQIRGRIELVGDGNTVEIGADSKVHGGFIGAHNGTSITIGAGCLIANLVDMRTTDSHHIFEESGQKINPDKNIEISDHVWLGLDVTILKGTVIGSHCVVGTRSLVTGTIPPHSIAAGIPAKVIRSGITWKE